MNKQGKAITAIALAAAMVLSLSACAGDSPDTSSSQESPGKFATTLETKMLAIITIEINLAQRR